LPVPGIVPESGRIGFKFFPAAADTVIRGVVDAAGAANRKTPKEHLFLWPATAEI
jgi:hypothetical protein